MRLVVDASIALAWCFEDESTAATEEVLVHVGAEGAIVPSLFHLELANVLILAERRGRVSADYVSGRLVLIHGLPIEVDDETSSRAWLETMDLARAERLTVYDASYLELALRSGFALATLDRDLAAAARRRGVEVLP